MIDGMGDANPSEELASAAPSEAKPTLVQPAKSKDLAVAEIADFYITLSGGN